MDPEYVKGLLEALKSVDTPEYYTEDTDEENARLAVMDAYNKLIELGPQAIHELAGLTLVDTTWSSKFALEIMRKIKNQECAVYFIRFLKNNTDSHYDESLEEAMNALIELGEPVLPRLIRTVLDDFENRTYNIYLVGAITGQKNEQAFSFLTNILQDYIENNQKYEGWFWIDSFCHDFEVHGKKEAIPLLLKVKDGLPEGSMERREIESTIEFLEDPEKCKKEREDDIKEIRSILEFERKPLKELVKEKGVFVHIGDANTELYWPLLYAIDSSILKFWELNEELKDIDVLRALKKLKHNIYGEFDEDSLEWGIIRRIKHVLREKQYTEMEIISCIRRLEKSVKFHREQSGSRGYLNMIKTDFSEEDDDIDEDGALDEKDSGAG